MFFFLINYLSPPRSLALPSTLPPSVPPSLTHSPSLEHVFSLGAKPVYIYLCKIRNRHLKHPFICACVRACVRACVHARSRFFGNAYASIWLVHTLAGYDCAHIGIFEPNVLQIASDLRALRPVLTQDRYLVLRHPAVLHQASEYAHLRTIHIYTMK